MISAVILAHNDEAILSRCLESLFWCDEVVVIDDHSTDRTVALAKKLGAKVFVRPLHDDFASQRNFGLSKAKGEWVLFVDSDEIITMKLAREIRLLTQHVIPAKAGIQYSREDGSPIESGMTEPLGYYLKRKDWWGGTWLMHGETANIKLLRLAKKNAGSWQRPVHEVWMVQGAVGELNEPLLHFPHPNVAQFLEEINRYSSLNAQFLYRKNIGVRWWQIAAYPAAKFFVNYVWRLGFLDGTAGMVVAFMMSFHSFLVRGKLWKLWYCR